MRYVEGVVGEICGANAVVDIEVREGGCGRCHEVGGCGGQNLSRALCDKTRTLTVANTIQASVGERVRVGIEDAAIGAMATRVYVVPLAGVLLGAAVGQALLLEAGGSVIGAALGFAVSLLLTRKWRSSGLPVAVMVRRDDSSSVVS